MTDTDDLDMLAHELNLKNKKTNLINNTMGEYNKYYSNVLNGIDGMCDYLNPEHPDVSKHDMLPFSFNPNLNKDFSFFSAQGDYHKSYESQILSDTSNQFSDIEKFTIDSEPSTNTTYNTTHNTTHNDVLKHLRDCPSCRKIILMNYCENAITMPSVTNSYNLTKLYEIGMLLLIGVLVIVLLSIIMQ